VEENKPEVKVEPVALAVEPKTIPAVVVEAKPEVVVKPEPELQVDKKAGLPGAGIFVQLSALVPHSRRKNSRSVTSVQARLIELGFDTAGEDDRGHFSDGTVEALQLFAKDKKIKAESLVDESVIIALFKGTAVEVIA
jgi:peptidoglycan hydrolase-like protein with peptidoglycan-binding domain